MIPSPVHWGQCRSGILKRNMMMINRPLQIDLRSNYERKSDGIGPLMKQAEIVGKGKHSPTVQVRQ